MSKNLKEVKECAIHGVVVWKILPGNGGGGAQPLHRPET